MSDSVLVGLILTFSGGYMDAYTYLFRDGVFANAQTGNIILLGLNLFEGNILKSLNYLLPICAFMAGVFIAQIIHFQMQPKNWFHWRQLALFIEIVLMTSVIWIMRENALANSLVSFACGIQVQSFRTIDGKNLATTMCVGNLRTGTDYLCAFLYTKNKKKLRTSLFYFLVIVVFILGAIGGKIGVQFLAEKAPVVNVVLLIAAFILMMAEPVQEQNPGIDPEME